ncbi:MAG: restriction endonuclease subunit S, partial [Ruminococcus sp.]|nr:restriction endonuclease subunit S [Ruminococcus sp.]
SGGIIAYINKFAFDKPSVLIPRKGSIDKLYYVDKPFWNVDTIFYTDINTTKAIPRYVYHCLLKEHLEQYNTAGGVPSLTQKILNKVKIPVPPLEIQLEIVGILDEYSEKNEKLIKELYAETELRKKQYSYYRDYLLNFGDDVERKTLGEICKIIVGGEAPSDCIKGNFSNELYKYPIWANGQEVYGYAKNYTIESDAVCISSIGANAGAVFFHSRKFTPIIRLKVLIPKINDINIRYLFHAVSVIDFVPKKSSVPNISSNDIKKIIIPIPTIEEQEKIVKILDRFDKLCNDISEGLPAEIKARQKQYEYYRNKLLQFKIKDS